MSEINPDPGARAIFGFTGPIGVVDSGEPARDPAQRSWYDGWMARSLARAGWITGDDAQQRIDAERLRRKQAKSRSRTLHV